MTGFTDIFSNGTIVPSDVSYRAIALDADQTLTWPEETQEDGTPIAQIMDVTPDQAGWSLILPDARAASPGETSLIANVGAFSFDVKNATGTIICTLEAGTVWQVYLTVNTTEAGTWLSYQYGAANSSYNAAALAGTGLIATGALLSLDIPVTELNTSPYDSGIPDRAKAFNWTGAGGTITVPNPSDVGNGWFIQLRNSGSGTFTIDPDGGILINGAATLGLSPGDSATVFTDGVAYYTIGLGRAPQFTFDYTSIDVAGTGDYTLTTSELNRIVYKFTGILTGNRNIIVPDTVQQYWVDNATTGAFDLEVKTALGAGIVVVQGAREILYSDGTDVIDADTSSVSTPIGIADGGTGATTASGARVNLGGTSVGIALFTAASQAAAWAALGDAPTIDGGVF